MYNDILNLQRSDVGAIWDSCLRTVMMLMKKLRLSHHHLGSPVP